MNHNPHQAKGFTLLIAIILSSVALSVGVALGHISTQQIRLATVAKQSASAFYAADTALECALALDQREDAFNYYGNMHNSEREVYCPGGPDGSEYIYLAISYTENGDLRYDMPSWNNNGWYRLAGGTCARFTVTKTETGRTAVYAQGISSCDFDNPDRIIERGSSARY